MAQKTRRRDRGQGSLSQRSSDGMWIGYVTLPPDPLTGKRRRKTVSSKSKAVAAKKLRELRRELDRAGDLPTSSPTLERWLATWLDRIAAPRLKPRTLTTYRGYVEQYIAPTIGKYRLERLTPDHVRRLHGAILGRGLSSTTALQAHRILVVALRDAEREGKVSRNVATLVDAPRRAVATRAALTANEARRLLLSIAGDSQAAARWSVALLAGLRQGESLGLTHDAVDLDAGVITVVWQVQRLTWQHGCGARPCGKRRGGACPDRWVYIPPDQEAKRLDGGLWMTRPKSRAGWRQVPMAPHLREILARYMAEHPAGMEGLVFSRPDGRPLDPAQDSRQWAGILEAAGLPHVPLHSARHTTATLLADLGAPEQMRMQVLGHSSATVTRGYTHLTTQETAAWFAKLGALVMPPAEIEA